MIGPATVRRHYWAKLAIALVLLLLVVSWSLAVGPVRIRFWDALFLVLAHAGLPVSSTATPAETAIVIGLRLPRVLLAALCGAALALAGTLLQGALRTRLAEPVTTGTAAGALLGAAVALFATGRVEAGLLDQTPGAASLMIRFAAASLGAAVATLLVVTLVRRGPRVLPGPLLLGGLGVNAVVGAAAALLLFLGSIGVQTAATVVIAWTFGGLLSVAAAPAPALVAVVLFLAILSCVPLWRPLDLLVIGEEEAVAGGVALAGTRRGALVAASVLVGVSVASVGIVAFVGLLAPRVATWTVGPRHSLKVPLALVAGAVLLVAADTLGRLLAAPGELPAGVVMAFLGAPLLLALLWRDLKEGTA